MIAPGHTRRSAVEALRACFARAGLDQSALDARLLVQSALALDPIALLTDPDVPLGDADTMHLGALAERRLAHEPIGRILGEREFWGLPFRLSPGTLEPRPDTETAVAEVLAGLPGDRRAALLDIGTGSGCILVACLTERPLATGIGTDRSTDALATARANAVANGVGGRAHFLLTNWADALDARFDVIVSNPPYIPRDEIAGLAPEVSRYDPAAALDGGPDGLDAYRALLADVPRLLAPEGCIVFEIGYDQADAVSTLARPTGLAILRVVTDLGGHDRAVVMGRAR